MSELITTACSKCAHLMVCKHRNGYADLVKNYDYHIDAPFTLSLHCDFFRSDSYSSANYKDFTSAKLRPQVKLG